MCVRDQMFDQREAISLLVKIHIAQTLQTDLPIVSLLVETPSHLAQTPYAAPMSQRKRGSIFER